jgi:hypothetical protein
VVTAGLCEHQLCLYVRWHSAAGAVKVNRLPLEPISGVDDLRGLSRCALLLHLVWGRQAGGSRCSQPTSRQQACRAQLREPEPVSRLTELGPRSPLPPRHNDAPNPSSPRPRRRLIKGGFGAGSLPDYLTCHEFYKFSPAEELISLPGDIARTEFRLVVTLDGWEYTGGCCFSCFCSVVVGLWQPAVQLCAFGGGGCATNSCRRGACVGHQADCIDAPWTPCTPSLPPSLLAVCERELPGAQDPQRKLLVTVSVPTAPRQPHSQLRCCPAGWPLPLCQCPPRLPHNSFIH